MIDYRGYRRYLVSLSTRDFGDKISPKAFAVAWKIQDALECIESVSGIEADYDCLRNFIDKFFKGGMVDSDIVGDELGAYSVSINFKLKDSQYTWMYLTITLVYINMDDFNRSPGTRPFISVVCDKASIGKASIGMYDSACKNRIVGRLGCWDFYSSHAYVENLFISRFPSTLIEVSAVQATRTYRHGIRDENFPKDFIDFQSQTYVDNSKTEKVHSSESPCRNVQTFSIFLSNVRCKDTQINFYVFLFPVIWCLDGIITFQSYETYSDYSTETS